MISTKLIPNYLERILQAQLHIKIPLIQCIFFELIKIDVYIIFCSIFQFAPASLNNLLNVTFIANGL